MPEAPWLVADLERVTARVRAALAPVDDGALQRIAEAVHAMSGGCDGLVEAVLAEGGEPWQRPDVPVDDLARPGGRVATWVQDVLLPALGPETRRLLGLLAGLSPLPRALVSDLAPRLVPAFDELVVRRLVLPDPDGTPRLVPLVSAAADPAVDRRVWLHQCVGWYLREEQPGAALVAARLADDRAACVELVEDHGDRIIQTGSSRDVLAALPRPPADASDRFLARWGHAARVSGRPLVARRALERVVSQAVVRGVPHEPDVTWRLAQVDYGQGDYQAAVQRCRTALDPRVDEPPDDRAMRFATLSVSLRALGERDEAAAAAALAVDVVHSHRERVSDSTAAMALMSHAMLLVGARRLNLLAEALNHAELAEDLVLTQRLLVNLSDAHLVGAEYARALERTDQALALVHRIGPVGCFTVALHNRGEALLGLGDLPAARTAFLRCLDLARRHGVARTPAALHGLAEADYQAGRTADADVGFREAGDLAAEIGDFETLGPVLGRLATILAASAVPSDASEVADTAGALEEAVRQADLAVAYAEPDFGPAALVARGWVAVAAQDPDAATYAATALEAARTEHVRRTLGEALELRAAAATDAREALEALENAIDVYDRAGSTHRADLVRLTVARLPQATRDHRAAGRAALRRLRRSDVSPVARHHPGGALAGGHAVVRVLGAFHVQVDGRPVAGSAWRSRQARTLFKILLARYGRPVSREELREVLWPDDDPARTGHRLSVLLSTLRSALDPSRQWAADRFLIGDSTGIRVSTEHVTVDLYDFLADADEATALADGGQEQAARTLFTELLQEHVGDAFEDDPFDTWAQQARDHVRNVQVQCLRSAAGLAGRAADVDQAITLLTRLLAVDPYDEPAHRLLLAALDRAGRHGDARRAYERWARANAELGIAAPEPLRRLDDLASRAAR